MMASDRAIWRFAEGGAWDLSSRTHIMGILNVTPDSFSDGGRWLDPGRALARGLEMAEEGADVIDVGGESTRPGAAPVDADEEARRVLPVVRALRAQLPQGRVRISIDTRKADVAAAALDAGADIVNDITGLRGDPKMALLLGRRAPAAVLMHIRGTPATMQQAPFYADLMREIADELRASCRLAREAGLADDRIVLDPGIGFGKTVDHNLAILERLP